MKDLPHILVVDDNASLADNIVEYLNHRGYRAQAAYGGREGLEAFERNKFKVVVTDLMMPGMDGMALLHAIRKRDPDAVVIMLTGFGTIKNAVEAIKSGANEFITKPLRPEEIERTIEKAMEGASSSRPFLVFIPLLLADLFLLVTAFGLMHLIKYGHLNLSSTSYQLLTLQAMALPVVSLFADKFTGISRQSLIGGASLLVKTGIAFMFVLSLVLVGLHLTHFSRLMAYGTITISVTLEVGIFAFYRWVRGAAVHLDESPPRSSDAGISGALIVVDGVLLVLSFFLITYFKRGSFHLYNPYDDILLLLLGLWLAFSMLTRKFDRDNFRDISLALGPAVKTAIFMAAGLTFFVYSMRMGPISRLQTLGAIPLFVVLEGFVFLLYSNYRRHGRMEADIEDFHKVRTVLDKGEKDPLPEAGRASRVTEPVEVKLKHALEFFDLGVFEFISSHVDLKQVDRSQCALLNTDELHDLNFLDECRCSLIVNLHKLNDVRWFNRYFLVCHEKLRPGGYLVGKAHTTSTQYDSYLTRYPGLTGQFLYGLRFVWSRVFPKVPWIRKIYFSITRGRNRVVSRAELLGRLSFCGFEIVAEKEIRRRLFIIARKVSAPSWNRNPSYGPIVTLNRIVSNGKVLPIYKFRTMHPYSEFIQGYVFNNQGLQRGGKLENDFRVTGWGKVMRRLWLDELPMLYNWVRGDLQLFGVRPLSRQYLNLYDEELRALRSKVKPGLIPPFYADLPETLEEIMESERRYIEAYLRHPTRTQLTYLWKSFVNIAIKGARSN